MAFGFVRKRGSRWYVICPVTDPKTGQRKKKSEVAGNTRQAAQQAPAGADGDDQR